MIETVVGKRGRGKTSLIAEMLAKQRRDQIFIFDYCAEFGKFAVPDFCYVTRTGFQDFFAMAWKMSRQGISTLMVLDEVAIYGRNNPWLDHVFRLGRHKEIDIVSSCQRFFGMPPIIRALTDLYHVFQVTEERDIKYLKNYVSQPVLDVVMGLARFRYINLSL